MYLVIAQNFEIAAGEIPNLSKYTRKSLLIIIISILIVSVAEEVSLKI
jgi:hypothetical protein